jgi:hypothetical protein
MLQARRDVGQQHKGRVPVRGGQFGRELLEHPQFRSQCSSLVHVRGILARPMERPARPPLQARQVNPVALIKPQVTPGEILPHHPDQLDRAKETRRHRRMAGRAAQQARVLRFGGFDGIQGGRSDNKNFHREVIQGCVRGPAPGFPGGGALLAKTVSCLFL